MAMGRVQVRGSVLESVRGKAPVVLGKVKARAPPRPRHCYLHRLHNR